MITLWIIIVIIKFYVLLHQIYFMKKLNLLLLSSVFTLLLCSSCNSYTSLTQANKIGQLRGNPFMFQVSKSVISSLKSYAKTNGISVNEVTLLSPLSTIFTNPEQLGAFKRDIFKNYKVVSNYKTMNEYREVKTVKELINFISKNGRGFNFYSSMGI